MTTSRTHIQLNDEQRTLVENNHNLIYSFLNLKSLDNETWYDLAAIGLCRAAYTFDQTLGHSFTTYAYCVMDSLVRNEKVKMMNQKRIPSDCLYSLDEISVSAEGNDYALYNILSTNENVEESVLLQLMLNEFYQSLSKRRKKVLFLCAQGLTPNEIADCLGTSVATIQETRRVLRNDFRKWRYA